MPRNSAGTYSLPEPAFQPSTPISSAAVNSDFSDIGDGLTDSLSRSGQGGMQAALPMNVAGFHYQGDTNTGMRRSAADTQVITCGGVDVVEATPTGINVAGDIKSDGLSLLLPAGVMLPYGGASAPAGYLLCNGASYLRADYPALFAAIGTAYGSVDAAHFNVPDLRGTVPAGADGGTGRLTTANSGVDGATLGAVGGLPNPTILTANLPPYTPAGSFVGATDQTKPILWSTSPLGSGVGGGATGVPSNVAQTHLEASLAVTGTFTGTAQGGASTPVKTQPRTLITNYIIYAGA